MKIEQQREKGENTKRLVKGGFNLILFLFFPFFSLLYPSPALSTIKEDPSNTEFSPSLFLFPLLCTYDECQNRRTQPSRQLEDDAQVARQEGDQRRTSDDDGGDDDVTGLREWRGWVEVRFDDLGE